MVEVEDEESEGVPGSLGTSDFLLEPLDSEPAVVDRRQRIESGNPLQILVIEGIGEGDGQVSQVIKTLVDGGYSGFLSIEPHLGDFDAFGGLCGPDLWTSAHTALVTILNELGLEYA